MPTASHHRRAARGLLLAAGAAAAFAAGGPGPDDAAAAQTACERLRGHDLAPAKSIKLVERRTGDDSQLIACALPAGRPRTIAARLTGATSAESFRLREVAGAFAAITSTIDDQYASAETTSIINLRTGARRQIASLRAGIGDAPHPGDTQIATVAITSGGRAAASVTDPVSGTVTILTLGTHGATQTLDTGPPANVPPQSLTLTGATISWLHDGARRTAHLP